MDIAIKYYNYWNNNNSLIVNNIYVGDNIFKYV